MSTQHKPDVIGPFRVDQLRSGDRYELSNGQPIWCAPTGQDGAESSGLGFTVLNSDPAVKRAGVDAGLALTPDTLRAPDIAVNFEPGEGTWARSTPLAVEYAGAGQNEVDLREKIVELFAAGTKFVWVVRLTGVRRVDVHEPGVAMRTLGIDATLDAPGVLSLPVPVRALFERDAAHETTLRNLLAAHGYQSLDAVRDEARNEARNDALALALRTAVEARGWSYGAQHTARVAACHDTATLTRWIARAVTEPTLDAIFD
jgi:hypothetical protein